MEQRVAVVTGGLRGLGRAMALGLAKAGHRVAVVGHIEAARPELNAVAAEQQLRDRVWPLVADLRKPEECDRIVAEIRARFGSLDILVNNAGLTFTYIDPTRFRRPTIQRFWEVPDEIVENVIVTNYLARDRLSRRAARLVEPEEMVPPLRYVVSREADRVNGMRFDANAWDAALAPAEAARLAGRPAGFVLHPQAPPSAG